MIKVITIRRCADCPYCSTQVSLIYNVEWCDETYEILTNTNDTIPKSCPLEDEQSS